MSYQVNFLDNEMVTAEYLNNVTGELGDGVLAFQDDMTYGVDDLNTITETLVAKGVSRGCSLSVMGGKVLIAEGVLFMGDGKRVAIDADGVEMEYQVGVMNYVWFYHDIVTGFVTPRCTEEEPSGEDYVQLGMVTSEGIAQNKADRAVMKNPFLGLHGFETFTKTFGWNGILEETLLWELELADSGYQQVVVYTEGTQNASLIHNACCGAVNLTDKTAFSSLCTTAYGSNGQIGMIHTSTNSEILVAYAVCSSVANRYHHVYLRFEIGAGNILKVYQRATATGSAGYNNSPAVQLKMIVC